MHGEDLLGAYAHAPRCRSEMGPWGAVSAVVRAADARDTRRAHHMHTRSLRMHPAAQRAWAACRRAAGRRAGGRDERGPRDRRKAAEAERRRQRERRQQMPPPQSISVQAATPPPQTRLPSRKHEGRASRQPAVQAAAREPPSIPAARATLHAKNWHGASFPSASDIRSASDVAACLVAEGMCSRGRPEPHRELESSDNRRPRCD